MTFIKSFLLITSAISLLQQSLAIPIEEPNALLKQRHSRYSLSGKFLHITDAHLDPYYLQGSDPETSCHRNNGKMFKEVGLFGALGTDCDSPFPLVQTTFEFLQKQVQDIDFIIYTGDTVRHDRDEELLRTRKDVLDGHKIMLAYFEKAYNTERKPLIPTLGNNDSFEHDSVTGNDPIFPYLKKIWRPLDLNLNQDFDFGGYFVQDLVPEKLSVINLNSMYFYKNDLEVKDCDDPASPGAIEMKWFEKALKHYYNKKGHQVYVVGHVPPIADDGSSLYKDACYSQYLYLLGKYGSIISGHFTGHTNDDVLNAVISSSTDQEGFTYIAPDSANAANMSVALEHASMALFNAPSVIPKNNPALRIYHYNTHGNDCSFGTIRNWKQYYVDLKKANKHGHVEYELEYTASDLYGVDRFDGPGVGQAIFNVANDQNALDLYTQYIKVSSNNTSAHPFPPF